MAMVTGGNNNDGNGDSGNDNVNKGSGSGNTTTAATMKVIVGGPVGQVMSPFLFFLFF
jgi:hypothetical protein